MTIASRKTRCRGRWHARQPRRRHDCMHGDTPGAAALARRIRDALDAAGSGGAPYRRSMRRSTFPTMDFGRSGRNSTPSGDLVRREPLAADRHAGLLRSPRPASTPPTLWPPRPSPDMRHAGDGHLVHGGMRGEDFLDLARPHLEAACLDHVLLTIDEEDVSMGVHVGEIAGVEPRLPSP